MDWAFGVGWVDKKGKGGLGIWIGFIVLGNKYKDRVRLVVN